MERKRTDHGLPPGLGDLMMASGFDKVLREVAEARNAAGAMQPGPSHAAVRHSVDNWLNSEPARKPATQRTAADVYLRACCAPVQKLTSVDQPLTLEELKRRIRAGLTKKQVSALRRKFAIQCHPDRAGPLSRKAATDLMAEANNLLDKASGASASSR